MSPGKASTGPTHQLHPTAASVAAERVGNTADAKAKVPYKSIYNKADVSEKRLDLSYGCDNSYSLCACTAGLAAQKVAN
jgi:hypothetical protein